LTSLISTPPFNPKRDYNLLKGDEGVTDISPVLFGLRNSVSIRCMKKVLDRVHPVKPAGKSPHKPLKTSRRLP
jgi:hypothetical protein